MVCGIENRGESMPKTRKSHPPSLKAKVAVEAIKAHKTAAQIAQMFGVHPTQVGSCSRRWKTISTFTITSARTRRSAIERRPICFRTDSKGTGRLPDGGLCPPSPLGFIAFIFQNGCFCFTANGTCRTIERLDRKTGLRRDATRAPTQARNGWRPHGRRLGQPAAPSKNGRNFVQTMGSTSITNFQAGTRIGRVLAIRDSQDISHR